MKVLVLSWSDCAMCLRLGNIQVTKKNSSCSGSHRIQFESPVSSGSKINNTAHGWVSSDIPQAGTGSRGLTVSQHVRKGQGSMVQFTPILESGCWICKQGCSGRTSQREKLEGLMLLCKQKILWYFGMGCY